MLSSRTCRDVVSYCKHVSKDGGIGLEADLLDEEGRPLGRSNDQVGFVLVAEVGSKDVLARSVEERLLVDDRGGSGSRWHEEKEGREGRKGDEGRSWRRSFELELRARLPFLPQAPSTRFGVICLGSSWESNFGPPRQLEMPLQSAVASAVCGGLVLKRR